MNSFNHYLFNRKSVLLILLAGLFISSCYNDNNRNSDREITTADQHEEIFLKTMQNHLEAVSNRDLTALKGTLPPDGNMQLVLPGREMTTTAEDFIRYHREWFQDTTWTLESEILDTEIGEKIGIAITEIIYREPEKSYVNKMTVSYALKKIEEKWYVFKDHASSVETSDEQ